VYASFTRPSFTYKRNNFILRIASIGLRACTNNHVKSTWNAYYLKILQFKNLFKIIELGINQNSLLNLQNTLAIVNNIIIRHFGRIILQIIVDVVDELLKTSYRYPIQLTMNMCASQISVQTSTNHFRDIQVEHFGAASIDTINKSLLLVQQKNFILLVIVLLNCAYSTT